MYLPLKMGDKEARLTPEGLTAKMTAVMITVMWECVCALIFFSIEQKYVVQLGSHMEANLLQD